MHPRWQALLADQRDLLDSIEAKVQSLSDASGNITPPLPQVMRAFETNPQTVRVLIVGQDPYPTAGHAIGLAFAVLLGQKPIPRSLQNILRELHDDLPSLNIFGELENWQSRGVMLLNRHLTTQVGHPGAHSKLGWDAFTAAAVTALAELHAQKLVALLWGNHAQTLTPLLGGATVLRAAHPSPLSASRGFFGSKPFSGANEALKKMDLEPIDWSC